MAAISASMVAELRAKTDAPMMECKKALTEADGNFQRPNASRQASAKDARRFAHHGEGVVPSFIDAAPAAARNELRKRFVQKTHFL